MNGTENRDAERRQYRPLRIVIAGGGTGGHVFPGIAMADAFKARNGETRILFVGTGNRFEKIALAGRPFERTSVTAEGVKGRGIYNKMKAIVKVPKGICEAAGILKRFAPDLVLGVGGYSSGPVVMAAWLLGVPIVLQEQNSVPGLANRKLARFARRVFVSFEGSAEAFPAHKVLVTGNPVRREIIAAAGATERMEKVGFTVLVCGGSQGARAINRAVMEALPAFSGRTDLLFIHQTGSTDEGRVKGAYQVNNVIGEVGAFFRDMATRYARADLVICRAGATTVAELTAMGKPVIFIPYPHAADQHQTINAGTLSEAGAAELIPESSLSGERLVDRIEHFADTPADLAEMARQSRRFGRPDAAETIVTACYELLAED